MTLPQLYAYCSEGSKKNLQVKAWDNIRVMAGIAKAAAKAKAKAKAKMEKKKAKK